MGRPRKNALTVVQKNIKNSNNQKCKHSSISGVKKMQNVLIQNKVQTLRKTKILPNKRLLPTRSGLEDDNSDVCFKENKNEQFEWLPKDDLKLILNVLKTNNIIKVYESVRFSKKFNVEQLFDRWEELLFNSSISNESLTKISNIHSEIIKQIEQNIPFTDQEKCVLKSISNNTQMNPKIFEQILKNDSYREIFCENRSPDRLYKEWSKMSLNNRLISDSSTVCYFVTSSEKAIEYNKNIYELEEKLQEITNYYQQQIQQLRIAEEELKQLLKFQALFSGVICDKFDSSNVIATLRGHRIRFILKSREITLGRTTKDVKVDVDLTHEGYVGNISRFQAVINYLSIGKFIIYNCGTSNIQVNTTVVPQNEAAELFDGCLLKIGYLVFVFNINKTWIMHDKENLLFQNQNQSWINC